MAKISIGTAQWGLEYGISNVSGIPSSTIINEIINYARINNIKMIDTAGAYGNAEFKLGENRINDFNIVSKIYVKKGDAFRVEDSVKDSLFNLKLKSIYGCLIHNPEELLSDTKIWEAFKILKNKGLIKKIGYSVYDNKNLRMLLKNKIIPDIVQLPYNILDRKFENEIDLLKKEKIEIHVRSIFLQGLYFMDPNNLPSNLEPLSEPLNKLKKFCKSRAISMLELCLSFVLKHKKIDYIVVGVESLKQLKQINDVYINNNFSLNTESIGLNFSFNKNLLNPSKW